MLKKIKLFILLYLFISLSAFSENRKVDSLRTLSSKGVNDTNKVKFLNDLIWEFMDSNTDSAIFYGNQALAIAEQLKFEKGLAETLRNLGTCNFTKANFPLALDFYLKSLKIEENIQNKKGIASCLSNIGLVYKNQNEYSKALQYYLNALKIDEELANKKGMAADLGNIGNVYKGMKEFKKALDYHEKALNLYKSIENKRGMAINYGSIGNVYKSISDFDRALENYLESLKLYQAIGNNMGVAISWSNIGYVYLKKNNFSEAEKYLKQSLQTSKTLGLIKQEMEASEYLSDLYQTTKNYQKALEHYQNAMKLKDSIFNEEKNNEITRKEMNYEFEKKEAFAKAEQDKKDIIAKEKLAQKEKERNYFVFGFLILSVLLIFIYKGYRNKQKANEIISFQKQLVEAKQKEIIDSIEYAKRIQLSLLPNEKYIEKNINRLNKKS